MNINRQSHTGWPIGRNGVYRVWIGEENFGSDNLKLFIGCYDSYGNRKPHTIVFDGKNGRLIAKEYENGSDPECLLNISRMSDADAIFTALADELYRIGYYPEPDNKQRITAEALAEERKNELEWWKEVGRSLIVQKKG